MSALEEYIVRLQDHRREVESSAEDHEANCRTEAAVEARNRLTGIGEAIRLFFEVVGTGRTE